MARFSKKDFDGRKMLAAIMLFWSRWYRRVFFLFFISMSIFGVVFWYQSLYLFQWSDSQKQEYRKSKATKAVFDQKSFDEVLKNLDHRREIYFSEYNPVRDIFKNSNENIKIQNTQP